MCAFGTFTCGEIGIGPKSLLAAVVLSIIESAVVDELNEADSEGGETALLLKSGTVVLAPPTAPTGYSFGLDG